MPREKLAFEKYGIPTICRRGCGCMTYTLDDGTCGKCGKNKLFKCEECGGKAFTEEGMNEHRESFCKTVSK